MIDLHSHILHGIDDGAQDMDTALEMARIAVGEGVEVMACTPHFLPGVYDPAVPEVMRRVDELNARLLERAIDLVVVAGCEAHVRPDMVRRLQSGELLTIHTSRYVLCEAPPAVLPPHMDRLFMDMMAAGYTPILAHVERYRWVERAMPWVERMAASGVLMQVTAGSFLGDYGRTALDLSLRLLEGGVVGIVASDAHDPRKRPPGMRKAWEFVKSERGEEEAREMFIRRPEKILQAEARSAADVGVAR
jgi:protein-tyrosine phosphatase